MSRIGEATFKTISGSASHPDFVWSPFVNFSSDSEARTQLLAGTYVFTLRHGVVVRGLVTSPDGQALPDADVVVGNAPGELGARKAKSGSDGTFQVPGCQPGKNRITAEAKGYAAKSIGVELSDTNSGPFQVSLAPGKVLKLRVIDDDGNPVPQASVALLPRPDLPMSGDPEPTAPPIRFNRQTDDQGRLKWDSAPDAELTFIVSAPGHMIKRDVKVQPDGIEHAVTLGPGLAVWGTVRDATTGQPIPRFRIIAGWPERVPIGGATFIEDTNRAHWSSFERDWYSFGGGKYELSYGAPMIAYQPNPVYMFKFEADGYRPFVTRVMHATERKVQLDVALTRGATTEVTVFAPDQSIAAGTQVGIVYPGAGLVLIPGGFSLQTIESATATALRTTDKQGHFMLPPDPAITKIVVANPQGYAEVTPAELAKNRFVQMAPWGRLEGIVVTNGQPLAGYTLSIGFGQGQVGLRAISCGFRQFQTKTDSQGRFSFTQVPTGIHNITLVTRFTGGNGLDVEAQTPLKEVTIRPNGTTTTTVEITSRVTSRLPTSPDGQ